MTLFLELSKTKTKYFTKRKKMLYYMEDNNPSAVRQRDRSSFSSFLSTLIYDIQVNFENMYRKKR